MKPSVLTNKTDNLSSFEVSLAKSVNMISEKVNLSVILITD